MLEFSWFICGTLDFLLYCFLFNKLIFKDDFKLNKKVIFLSVFFGLMYMMLMKNNLQVVRTYINHLYCFFALLFIYRKEVVKTIIGLFYIILIMMLGELLYDLVITYIFNINIIEVVGNWSGYLTSNIIIILLAIIISKIKIINKLFDGIISWYNRNEFKSIMIFFTLALTIVIFILYNNFFNFLPKSVLLFVNIFCLCVIVFVIGFFKEKSNNNKIKVEYEELMKYVSKYEKIIDEKSKNQHEYKNQLIFIKGMLNKNNKKAIEYIDSLYKNEKDDMDVEFIRKLQYIPEGGLKGLIYYKIDEMLSKNIQVFVDVSSKIKIGKEVKDNLQDISKIIGVYLDNAIEAAAVAKERYIIIEIYPENGNIVFSFSNTYDGIIRIDKVDKEGYTTKGKGKGYGLSLVKDIIDHNDILSQEKTIDGMYYVQKLIIKK